MALIIPFRDRAKHLKRFLAEIAKILTEQKREFITLVVEQAGIGLFNKGRLYNAGFEIAEALGADCFLFHDVDLLPESDSAIYECRPSQPFHLGAYVDTLNYTLLYPHATGGVLLVPGSVYRAVNGYSNVYWAWGGEDDDLGFRFQALEYTIERPPPNVRFKMMRHRSRMNRIHWKYHAPIHRRLLNESVDRMPTDGLNSNLWTVVKTRHHDTHHHILVDVGKPTEAYAGHRVAVALKAQEFLNRLRRLSSSRPSSLTQP